MGVVGRGWQSERLDLDGAGGAQANKDDLIFHRIDDFLQPRFQAHQIERGDATQEYRQLPAAAKVLAGLGNAPQAFGMADVVGDDVGFHRKRESYTCRSLAAARTSLLSFLPSRNRAAVERSGVARRDSS